MTSIDLTIEPPASLAATFGDIKGGELFLYRGSLVMRYGDKALLLGDSFDDLANYYTMMGDEDVERLASVSVTVVPRT
jgi:hypothetical protein